MPLNPAEKDSFARSMLECFGEDASSIGRALKFISQFAVTDLLTPLLNMATTWQPFIDSGLSIEWWKGEVTRYYNSA
jgi:hypothetical protein